ncbi:unnamed protein product [Clonostachys rhizophaga]|uniref:Uncharacterized protein n=1 Tax=Clonostachys rhizophaga TaxID=160324 RepID=A0A9N9VHW6_9HYPO|nr:unnamed protein product [Clonostachys rhizophaga]
MPLHSQIPLLKLQCLHWMPLFASMGMQQNIHMSSICGELILAGPMALYMTDERGRVGNEDRDPGIDLLTNDADTRILGQNLVARILEGVSVPLAVLPVWVDTRIRDGSLIDLNTAAEKVDHIRILNFAWQNYSKVHKKFAPFFRLPADKDRFPLGKQRTLQATEDQAERIEIVFPDNLPQPDAFASQCR